MVAHEKAESGLDTRLGDACSRAAYGWAKKSFANRAGRMGFPVFKAEGGFSNLMDYGGLRLAMTSDGIGTKVELAERLGVYDTLGHDLVAMTCDDLAAAGVEPVNLSNILDVDRLDEAVVDSLMRGLHAAAGVAGIAVVGGEIAELGDRIGGWGTGMHFN
ncbi:MAG: AIR synthase related protein [Pseudomonadota bacterium]